LQFSNLYQHTWFKSLIHKEDFEELSTIEMVVIGICGKSNKSFILIVFDGDDNEEFHAVFFSPKFYSQYMHLVELYNIGRPTIFFIKNFSNVVYGI
jgi:hypothetical protein